VEETNCEIEPNSIRNDSKAGIGLPSKLSFSRSVILRSQRGENVLREKNGNGEGF